MPDTVVRYQNRRGQTRELPIRFAGKQQNFVLQTDPLEQRMSAEIGPRLLDLLEIAAAIFCADSSISRGANHQPRDGLTWRRHMAFEFSVRDRAFWDRPDMSRLLRDAVEFMTDDRIDCHFVQADVSPNAQSYFRFRGDADEAFRVDDVVLFSGGLDSLVGALETLALTDRRIALVTHRSAPKTMHHQDELVRRLRIDFKDRFIWVPALVHRKKMRSSESTQRSRSMLFSALGCVVARMLGATRLQFFENGIVSQNLPLARPITGTLATRTTHPQTLKALQDLLSAVTESVFDVSNDFQWKTKTEVVGRLAEMGHADLIPLTVSCNHTFKRRSDVRHCGSCSQCLDRRFAILANGLQHQEQDDDYAVDVLHGKRDHDDNHALTVEWVRHARGLAGSDQAHFQSVFMSELLRISQAFPERRAALHASFQMHRRHGEAVVRVLDQIFGEQLAVATETSLASEFSGFTDPPAPPELAAELSEPEQRRRQPPGPDGILEIRRFGDNHVSILTLQDFQGAKARVISCLLDRLQEDRRSGIPIAKFRPIKAREIADLINVTEEYVRQEISRIRAELRESWRVVRGSEPPKTLLIRTMGKRGYLLDPTIHIVSTAPEG